MPVGKVLFNGFLIKSHWMAFDLFEDTCNTTHQTTFYFQVYIISTTIPFAQKANRIFNHQAVDLQYIFAIQTV
jgi:hypothetical protein